MAWNDGSLKLFNDVPSLLGYTSILLVVYKISCRCVYLTFIKKFFVWASGFGYELYLVHSLIYAIMIYFLIDIIPLLIWIPLSFFMAYAVAYGYSYIFKKEITGVGQ